MTCSSVGAACSTSSVNPGNCAQATVADACGVRNTDCTCWPTGAQDVDKEQDCGSVHAVATSEVKIPGTVTLAIQENSETELPKIRATLNRDEIGEFDEASGTFVLKFGQNTLDPSRVPVIIEELTVNTPSLFVQGAMTGPHRSVLDTRYPAVAEYNSNTGELNTTGNIRVLQTNDKFNEASPMEGYGTATATFNARTGDMIFNFCVETPIPKVQTTATSTQTVNEE